MLRWAILFLIVSIVACFLVNRDRVVRGTRGARASRAMDTRAAHR